MARTKETTEADKDRDIDVENAQTEAEEMSLELADVDHGAREEIIYIEERYDKNGDKFTRRQVKSKFVEVKVQWFSKYIIGVMNHYNRYGNFDNSTFEIYSEELRDILARVIPYYPGISFQTKHVSLDYELDCLYHYREELLEAHGEMEDDSVEYRHLKILIDYVDHRFGGTIEECANLRPHGLISYKTLWTLFRPGTIIHAKQYGFDRAFKCLSYHYSERPCKNFFVKGQYIDCDGEKFGRREASLAIRQFGGSAPIHFLPVSPLDFRTNAQDIRDSIIARGKRFETFVGQNHKEYLGVALRREDGDFTKYSIKSRIMVDGVNYNRVNSSHSWAVDQYDDIHRNQDVAELKEEEKDGSAPKKVSHIKPLEESELLLTTNHIRGFSLADKKWFTFFVENITDIRWNTACFERLVLPEASKQLVRGLVTANLAQDASRSFDDIIQGKGRGLIFVLHGPPGVGKTLTAECISEFSQRPLYVASSGELGTDASDLEKGLKEILDLSHAWKAVLLIDEADVFLEKRTLTDVNRNALVSVFLRLLEYYEGILFLTTNRVATFDPAFQSRIHMALAYGDLGVDARKSLWRDFILKLNSPVQMSESDFDQLKGNEMNGRQIKNTVKTAESLAAFEGQPMRLKHLQEVLTCQGEFASAFSSF